MWIQMIIVLVNLLILPSFTFAKCDQVPVISEVSINFCVVQWNGTYDTSCLEDFNVCWYGENTVDNNKTYECKRVDANTTTLMLDSGYWGGYVQVEVYAVGKHGSSDSDTFTAKGRAGLPVVTDLVANTANLDLIQLHWESLTYYNCFKHIELWICDDEHKDLNTCNFTRLGHNDTSFGIRNHNFPVCHNFSVIMDTTDSTHESVKTSLQLYINSNNTLTDATTMDVGTNSSVIKYNISIVGEICTKDVLEVKYYDIEAEPDTGLYEEFSLSEINSTGLVTLRNLTECAAYEAILSLKGSTIDNDNILVTFNTSKNGNPLLKKITVNNGTSMMVDVHWSIAENMRTACVSQLQVSWNTTADEASMKTQIVSVDAKNYSIQVEHNVTQTFYIQLDVLFQDDKWENHTRVYEW